MKQKRHHHRRKRLQERWLPTVERVAKMAHAEFTELERGKKYVMVFPSNSLSWAMVQQLSNKFRQLDLTVVILGADELPKFYKVVQ